MSGHTKKQISFVIVSFLFIFSCTGVFCLYGKNINVYKGGDLQGAINQAGNGDTITIHPGKYYGPFILRGKNIQFIGVAVEKATGTKLPVIHGRKQSRHFYIDNVGLKRIKADKTIFRNLKFLKGKATKQSIAGSIGGSFHVRNGAQITIEDCIFMKNVAKRAGAVACVELGSRVVIRNCQFIKNKANKEGAAIYNFNGQIEVYDSEISYNYMKPRKKAKGKSDGTAVFCAGISGFATVQNCVMDSNLSYVWGSAILITGGQGANITGNTITNNITTKHGAIVVAHNNHISTTETIIEDNVVDGNVCGEIGAGIYLENARNVNIIGNQIINNSLMKIAQYDYALNAGAFYSHNSTGVFNDNFVNNNSAQVIGALDFEENSVFTVEGNIITNNTATKDWPAIVIRHSEVDFRRNIIRNNVLQSNGNQYHAGSLLVNGSKIMIENNLFDNNSDILYSVDSNVGLINNTIVNNVNPYAASVGFRLDNSKALIVNNIFYKNEGTAIHFFDSQVEIYNNNFFDNYRIARKDSSNPINTVEKLNSYSFASDNMDHEVFFTNASEGQFQLSPNSYLIDAGLEVELSASYDLMGNNRFTDQTIDIGACEYQFDDTVI